MPEDYSIEISVYQLVLDRLTFLEDTATNRNLIGRIIFELMNEFEPCFQVGFSREVVDGMLVVTPATDRIGKEEYYSPIQKSILADLTAVYILNQKAAGDITTQSEAAATGVYIKRAKAGSAEVEYDQFDAKKSSGITTNTANLLQFYRQSAIRRAAGIGCYFDFTDAGFIAYMEAIASIPVKFLVINSNCCCR